MFLKFFQEKIRSKSKTRASKTNSENPENQTVLNTNNIRDNNSGKDANDTQPDVSSSGQPLGLFSIPPNPLVETGISAKRFDVDIVAVHGLNGHAYNTWTHANGSAWLSDFLPKSIPGARVFSYGYPSKLFFSKSDAGIRDYSRDLLNHVHRVRQEEECEDRPLIFICHSLGGIVCKQALIIAREEDRFTSLLNATTAIFFLGTPHRGSRDATHYGKIAGDILNACLYASASGRLLGKTKTDLLDDLKLFSPRLLEISESFRERCKTLQIVSVYETESTPPLRSLIVDKSSATMGIPGEVLITVYSNHVNLCRFDVETNPGYQNLISELKSLANEACKAQATIAEPRVVHTSAASSVYLEEVEITCIMVLLNTSSLADLKLALPRRVNGTCEWVLKHPLYRKWQYGTTDNMLWISGYPGCGKTALSSYLVEHLSNQKATGEKGPIICGFFCNENVETRRDGLAVLRSLIFQVLSCRRELARHAKQVYDDHGNNLISSFTALWKIFKNIITHHRTGSVHIIIDALDECEGISRQYLLESISELLRTMDTAEYQGSRRIKFLISSRLHQDIDRKLNNSSNCHLRLEETQAELSNDVRLLIMEKVEEIAARHLCKPETRKTLENSLLQRADRTFLWVVIILHQLNNNPLGTNKEFQKIILQMPQEMEAIYEGFLQSIRVEHQQLASKLLHIIVGSRRPLSLDELNCIYTIQSHHRTIAELEASEDWLPNMQGTLEGILGPLIRISDSMVYLVHLTAREFLLKLSQRAENPLSSKYGIILQNADSILANACVLFLNLQDFEVTWNSDKKSSIDQESPISPHTQAPTNDDSEEEAEEGDEDMAFAGEFDTLVGWEAPEEFVLDTNACQVLKQRYKFLDYSAMMWAHHLSSCENIISEELLYASMRILDEDSAYFKNWFQYFWASDGDMSHIELPSVVCPTTVASIFGLSEILRLEVKNGRPPTGDIAACALYWASRGGHEAFVQMLLGMSFAPDLTYLSNIHTRARQAPLHTAAMFGRTNIISLLMSDPRVNVNVTCSTGRTALSYAADNGHIECIKLLLGRSDLEANIPNHRQLWTALFWAVNAESTNAVLELLRSRKVQRNHQDKKGRTAFSYVAEFGLCTMAEVFLRDASVDVDLKDNRGRTPLSWAAACGRTEMVTLLANARHPSSGIRRVDLRAKDNDGRNAMSWATEGGRISVMEVLIKRAASTIDEEDIDGWTPLAWALNHAPSSSIILVQLLLSTGKVDVNHRDKNGQTCYSWAARYGYADVMQAMKATKLVNPDIPDNDGRTARDWAYQSGSADAIKESASV